MGKDIGLALLGYSNENSGVNADKALEEIKENRELLEDNNEDSSGSDSDPSEDNLDIKQLRKLFCLTPSAKTGKKQKKRCQRSESKSLPEKSNKEKSKENSKFLTNVVIKRPAFAKKPKILNEGANSGNFIKSVAKDKTGNRRFFLTSPSISTTYFNLLGKRVRDQGTQTIKLEEKRDRAEKSMEIRSDRSGSLSSNNEFDKSSEHSFLLKANKILPNLPRKTINTVEKFLPNNR